MVTAPSPSHPGFHVVDLIRSKCEGAELSDAQIDWLIAAYTDDEISALSKPTVDKHSTGGVGDKITLPLVPLVAACGVAVPQLAGRGLGHTGGTLDKLESIPGWRANLTNKEMLRQLADLGAVICAPGPGLVPADKKLYALRDVTGTVESIPLIASSIMSKKIAEGAGALVLDVKVGSGAFMKTLDSARELAETMVDLGSAEGVTTVALLTDMSVPLGLTAGNALEVAESVEVLAGGGPPDVVELTVALAREMINAVRWDDHEVLDARAVGEAARRLGAGRARKEHAVQAGAGVQMHAKPGMRVRAGQPLVTLHTDTPERFAGAREALGGGYAIDDAAPEERPIILDRIA
jgi:thymidine phosphorylase